VMEEQLDLRGEVCPYTYVKTKLALEQLDDGDVLRVLVDHEAAVANVPRSAQVDGHSVRSVRSVQPGLWEIVVQKGTSR